MSTRRSVLRALSRFLVSLLLLCPLGASLSAQRTWIVDTRGGGDFKKVQAAFDAANDGDTVLIRPGHYVGASTKKGLKVFGVGVPGIDDLTVSDLRASTSFAMKSIFVAGVLSLSNNKGRIHLEDVSVIGGPSLRARPGVRMRDCTHVSINGGDVHESLASDPRAAQHFAPRRFDRDRQGC